MHALSDRREPHLIACPNLAAARIFNKHLSSGAPIQEMELKDGDITWFSPNWYQTVRWSHSLHLPLILHLAVQGSVREASSGCSMLHPFMGALQATQCHATALHSQGTWTGSDCELHATIASLCWLPVRGVRVQSQYGGPVQGCLPHIVYSP
jgi:hypothetical protein